MPKFVKIEAEETEDVLFVCFGKLKTGLDAANSLLVKENESIEGVVTELKVSPKYGKIIKLAVKKQDKPALITGKQDLNKKLDKGNVKVNDLIRITYKGMTKTQNGNMYNNFEVEVATE